MKPRRTLALACALAAAWLLTAGIARADAPWSTPVDLADPPTALSVAPAVAIDASGNAVAAWVGDGRIYVARRPAGAGAWETATPISPAGDDVGGPLVAVDGGGHAVVVWSDTPSAGSRGIDAAIGPVTTGAWGSPATLSPSGVDTFDFDVAVNASGHATVLWGEDAGSNTTKMRAAEGDLATATWSSSVDVTPTGVARYDSPKVAVDAAGDSIAVWVDDSLVVTGNTIMSAVRPASGSAWTVDSTSLSGTESEPNAPDVGVDDAGHALVVWSADLGGGSLAVESVTASAASGGWSAAQPVVTYGPDLDLRLDVVHVAVDPSGHAVSVWDAILEPDTSHYHMYGALGSAATGAWAAPAMLSTSSDDAEQPSVAMDARGSAVAIWLQPHDKLIDAAMLAPGATTWQAPVDLSDGNEPIDAPAVAAAGDGATVAAWVYGDDELGPTVIQASLATLPAPVLTPPPTGGGTPPPSNPPAPPSPPLACTKAEIELFQVVPHGSKVLITGAARSILAGRTVSIVLESTHKIVATATIGSDGAFAASARLPAGKARTSDATRYEAVVGTVHSDALKLARRAYMTSVVRSGSHVKVSGRVTGKFRKGAKVAISLRVTCASYKKLTTVRLSRSGKFSATVRAPTAAEATIAAYRAGTTVLVGRRAEPTFTLPVPPR